MRKVANYVAFVVVALVLAGWVAFLRPQSMGGDVSYIVVRGTSMQPIFHTGDLVIVRDQAAYVPGQVVAYRVPEGELGAGQVVIHRIVGEEGGRFITQGDNNNVRDPWSPTDADIVGRPWVLLPGLGTVLVAIHEPAILGAIAAAVVVMVLVGRGPGGQPLPSGSVREAPGPRRHVRLRWLHRP
ncbi:MAG: signal peptidase I [Chloroflexota bacterium]